MWVEVYSNALLGSFRMTVLILILCCFPNKFRIHGSGSGWVLQIFLVFKRKEDLKKFRNKRSALHHWISPSGRDCLYVMRTACWKDVPSKIRLATLVTDKHHLGVCRGSHFIAYCIRRPSSSSISLVVNHHRFSSSSIGFNCLTPLKFFFDYFRLAEQSLFSSEIANSEKYFVFVL